MRSYYVYIMTNNSRTLYTGVTNDLSRRVHEHKTGARKGFTTKYKIDKLVYYEETTDVNADIAREKEIKSWRRKDKIGLIEKFNPYWFDLSEP